MRAAARLVIELALAPALAATLLFWPDLRVNRPRTVPPNPPPDQPPAERAQPHAQHGADAAGAVGASEDTVTEEPSTSSHAAADAGFGASPWARELAAAAAEARAMSQGI